MPLRIVLGAIAVIAAFTVLLAAAVALVLATLRVDRIAGAVLHAAAAGAELAFGAAALLAAVYVATRAAVSAFGGETAPQENSANSSRTIPAAN